MSNQKEKVQLKQLRLDVPQEIYDKLSRVAKETGFTMTLIIQLLVKYNLSALDIEHDVRRTLARIAKRDGDELKLSPRQKRIVEKHVQTDEFTRELL